MEGRTKNLVALTFEFFVRSIRDVPKPKFVGRGREQRFPVSRECESEQLSRVPVERLALRLQSAAIPQVNVQLQRLLLVPARGGDERAVRRTREALSRARQVHSRRVLVRSR